MPAPILNAEIEVLACFSGSLDTTVHAELHQIGAKFETGSICLTSGSGLLGLIAASLRKVLTAEYDGVIGIKQREIGEMLGLAEPNVSRSIKALTEAGLLSKKVEKGFDGRPVWHIDPMFEKQARDHADAMYEKAHGKPFKQTW